MLPITEHARGVYVCYSRVKDGPFKQVGPDTFLELSTPVIRNMKGDYVKFPPNPADFKPRCFADYYLYVFEHAFSNDIDDAVMTISYEFSKPENCAVCGGPTYTYYPDSDGYDENNDIILYALCERCFDLTHLADPTLPED